MREKKRKGMYHLLNNAEDDTFLYDYTQVQYQRVTRESYAEKPAETQKSSKK
jgi:hypothetical protein